VASGEDPLVAGVDVEDPLVAGVWDPLATGIDVEDVNVAVAGAEATLAADSDAAAGQQVQANDAWVLPCGLARPHAPSPGPQRGRTQVWCPPLRPFPPSPSSSGQ